MEPQSISNKSRTVDSEDQEKVDAVVRQLRPSTMVQRLSKQSKRGKPADKKMAGKKGRRILPEDLIEKIVAMMPFPSIFKAQCLSKSWWAKFEAISSQDDEEKKQLATSFQKQVRQWSNRWGSFYYLDGIKGYCFDQTFQNEIEFPSLSFLPGEWTFGWEFPESGLRMKGPLMYMASNNMTEILVANILTQKWKILPPSPALRRQPPVELMDETTMYVRRTSVELVISETAAETYELIVFCRDDRYRSFFAHIYDSKSETWSISRFDFPVNHDQLVAPSAFLYFFGPSAFLNGVFYFLPDSEVKDLLAFNLEERSWQVIRWSNWIGFPSKIRIPRTQDIKLLVCNDFLWMIWIHLPYIRVLRIDVELLRFEKVAHFGINEFEFVKIPGSKNRRIVFEINDLFSKFRRNLAYDPHKDEWSHVSTSKYRFFSDAINDFIEDFGRQWHFISFQPGLNPFLAP